MIGTIEEICADRHTSVSQWVPVGSAWAQQGLLCGAGLLELSRSATRAAAVGTTQVCDEGGQAPQETRAAPGLVDAQTQSEGTVELPLTCSDYQKETRLKCPTGVILCGPPGTSRPYWLKQWQTKPQPLSQEWLALNIP